MKKIYSVSIHASLAAFAVLVLLLVQENRRLRADGVAPLPPDPSGPAIGAAVPPTPVLRLDGRGDTLAFGDGDRERLVFFFTTTCPSCLDNQRAWKTLDARASGSAEVIAISLDDLESTRRYRERHGLEFPVAVAAEPRELALALGVTAVPTTVRIGVDGRISATWVGQLSDDDIRAAAAASSAFLFRG